MSEKLTLQDLLDMTPFKVFKTGVIEDETIHDSPIRWVAKRGQIEDWAIYYDDALKTEEQVKSYGYKLIERKLIEKLVPCTEEAYLKYRY